jgi:hypothetical protein
MTPEQERWAEATMVLRQHGGNAGMFVAERIGALAVEGDVAGIQRWQQIAARLQQLIEAGRA